MKSLLLFSILSTSVLFTGGTKEYTASIYSNYYDGKKTANGTIFYQNKLTAASNNYKLGTVVEIINKKDTTKRVVVTITDRMAKSLSNRIDLSKAAANKINLSWKQGITQVLVKEIQYICNIFTNIGKNNIKTYKYAK